MSGQSVGAIELDARINQKQFNMELAGITNMAKRAGKIIASALALNKIFDFGKASVKLASDLEQTDGLVTQVFKNMGKQVNNFAKESASQYGLTELMAKKYTSMFGAMSQAMGFTEKDSYSMGTSLAALAGDLTSVFDGMSQEDAFTKLKAVFSGETESLKSLGVVMTQTALDSFALANGFGKTTNQMSEAEKVALRYEFVMDRLSYAQGNFARESNTWAGMMSRASLDIQSAMADIGSALIRLFKPVLGIIGAAIGRLRVFAAYFKAFVTALTGGSEEESISEPIIEAAGAAEDIGGGLGNAGKNLKKVNDGANKLKKTLKSMLGIDELNILSNPNKDEGSSTPSDSGVGGGAGGIGGVPKIKIPELKSIKGPEIDTSGVDKFAEKVKSVFGKLKEKVQPFIDTVKSIDFGPLKDALSRLWQSVEPIVVKIGDGFAWVLNNILGPFAKWFTEEVSPRALDLISNSLTILNPLLETVKKGGQWFWDSFLKPISQWTGELFIGAMDTINGLLKEIGDWMTNNQETVDTIAISVAAFFAAWKVAELMSFIQQSGGVIEALKKITTWITAGTTAKIADKWETIKINALYAADFVKSIASATGALIKNVAQWGLSTGAKIADKVATIAHTVATTAATAATWAFNAAMTVLTSPIFLVVAAIAALIAIAVLLVKNWDKVKEAGAKAWEWIKNTWNSASNWFKTNVTEPIRKFFTDAFESIGNFISDKWNWILGLFSKGGQFFSGIAESIGSVFVNIVNGLISGINWVIAKPFDFLNGILNGISNFSIMGARPFGWLGNTPLPVPQIPYLAEGGWVEANTPRLAVIGDNKRYGEVVAPENKLNELLDRALERNGSSDNDNDRNITVVLKLEDDIELAKTVIRGYNKLAKQS